MADIQRQLVQFDEAIRLKRFDENATLREKRDAVLTRLRDQHNALRRQGVKVPAFDWFNQGSYQMGTGVTPADGDYDIDVGLRFDCTRADYSDPVALKSLVFRALDGHTQRVEMRRSCVTVFYQRAGEAVYHVDLAVYAQETALFGGRVLYIAKGKANSDPARRTWEHSDPEGLMRWVEGRCSDGADQQQYLRIVRALKRWRSEKFKTDGANAPTGIALTVAAGTRFRPMTRWDFGLNRTVPDDLAALTALVDALSASFTVAGLSGSYTPQYRLAVTLPVEPRADLCARMTDGQMTTLRERLIRLRDALRAAHDDRDIAQASRRLRTEFGDAFPVA
jgi:hypothetical protein